MKIGQLSKSCGCPVETIRYFEKIGLLPRAARRANGYRSYDESHRNWLRFILRSRALGFSQNEVRRLSDVVNQSQPACSEVHDLLVKQIEVVRNKLQDLERMEAILERLKSKCRDGTLHDCPVIEELLN